MSGWQVTLIIVVALGYILGNLLLLRDSANHWDKLGRQLKKPNQPDGNPKSADDTDS